MHLPLDVVRHTLGELVHVELVLEQRHNDFFNESTKLIESIWMDVSAHHVIKQLVNILWQWLLFPFDEEDPLVLERARPVGVDLQLPSDVLADDQLLREALVHEAVEEPSLLVRYDQLVPFVLL